MGYLYRLINKAINSEVSEHKMGNYSIIGKKAVYEDFYSIYKKSEHIADITISHTRFLIEYTSFLNLKDLNAFRNYTQIEYPEHNIIMINDL